MTTPATSSGSVAGERSRDCAAFSYTRALETVIADVIGHLPLFSHVQLGRVLVCYSWARSRSRYGVCARTFGLRELLGCDGSGLTAEALTDAGVVDSRTSSGRRPDAASMEWHFQGRPILYLLNFLLPRFHDLPFEEKVLTILHELYHVSPAFDGTLRVLGQVKHHHGRSRREYDQRLMPYVHLYLRERGESGDLEFLRLSAPDLVTRLGPVTGLWVRLPGP